MANSSARGRSLTPPQVVSMLVVFLTLSGVGGVLSAGFATPFVGVTAALTKASAELFEELPSDFNVQQPSQISTLLAADGSEIAQFYAENRIVVPLSEISVNMQNAIVAVEDQRFYQHQGVDPTGMVRALVSNNSGGSRQGASTLTQQYVRNTLIETGLKNDDHKIIKDATESTVARKLREMKFALSLEQKYSKQQILEGYLNIAAFSPSTYGVEASSLHYFNKHAKDLTVAEAALLAGTTNAPSAYDPESQPELAKNRRDWVLSKMLEEKFITQEQYDEAVSSEIQLDVQEAPAGCGAAGNYAYFCTYVVNEILGSENFGPDVASRRQLLTRGGLKITTTLDRARQNAADGIIQANTPIGDSDGANSTIVSVEPGTGRIQALAQNTNYEDSQLVFAADAKHGGVELPDGNVGFQPGSTFKALILAEWLKTGHTAGQTVNASAPRTYPPNTFNIPCAPELAAGSWTVNNVAGTNAGNMSVRDATKQSINVGFTEMLRQLDVCDVTQFAASIGVSKADGSQLDPDPSLALGAKPVPPLSMANAYATFASGGKYCKPVAIDSILDASGTSMAVPSADCTQAMDQNVADQTAITLQATSEPNGTAKDAGIGRAIAGKTGTTDEAENAWFVGFTPQLSTAVWIGDAKESNKSLAGRTIGGKYFERMYGSDLAVPMWRDYMSQALANEPAVQIPHHP
ncbi:transglycosylase domain-containing protein [Actinomyces sp. oral taxon 170]|uniref:transglycosylase domain-containing protein n=2 Tax=Actinomyces TaxID=1654 RepID=UPI0002EC724D|nr:transglycosylase domain-containing protein [Actinomyces sp. oral taxon 170]